MLQDDTEAALLLGVVLGAGGQFGQARGVIQVGLVSGQGDDTNREIEQVVVAPLAFAVRGGEAVGLNVLVAVQRAA